MKWITNTEFTFFKSYTKNKRKYLQNIRNNGRNSLTLIYEINLDHQELAFLTIKTSLTKNIIEKQISKKMKSWFISFSLFYIMLCFIYEKNNYFAISFNYSVFLGGNLTIVESQKFKSKLKQWNKGDK